MKYTAKNYFIDLFFFGLSVWLPSIIYLVLYEQFKGGSDGKYDIISIISYISFTFHFTFYIWNFIRSKCMQKIN